MALHTLTTACLNASAALSATTGTTSTHDDLKAHRGSMVPSTTLNILFGILAVVLAFLALIIAWLQLRRTPAALNAEQAPDDGMELAEVR